jgi:hypothetical protein
VVYNAGIQTLGHFSCKKLRNGWSKGAKLNCVTLERVGTPSARDVVHDRSACRCTAPYTHAEASPRPMDHVLRSLVLVCGPGPDHAVLPHRLDGWNRLAPLVGGRRTSPLLPPYSGHAETPLRRDCLSAQGSSPPPCARLYKLSSPFHVREHRAAVVRHRCRHSELPASCVHDGV